MLITTMAMLDLAVRRESLLSRFRRWVRADPAGEPVANVSGPPVIADVDPHEPERPRLTLVSRREPEDVHSIEDAETAFRWRRHPALLAHQGTADSCEHRARRFAVKGLLAANEGDIAAARAWFAQALTEEVIDLTAVPAFWQMPRAAIIAAVDAYELNGCFREAAALEARVETELRPRKVIPFRKDVAAVETPRSTGVR